MPNSFGCEATDWLRGDRSSRKRVHTWRHCCHFGWTLLKVNGLALFSEQYANDVFKTLRNIHFCAVDRVDLVCGTCEADSLKESTRINEETTSTGGSVYRITVIPKNWQDFL